MPPLTLNRVKMVITWGIKVKILKIWVQIIIGKNKHFKFYNYCSTYTLKFFTTDNWDSPLLFTNDVLIDSPTYLRHTSTRPSRDPRESIRHR